MGYINLDIVQFSWREGETLPSPDKFHSENVDIDPSAESQPHQDFHRLGITTR